MDILEKLREKQGYFERIGFEILAQDFKEAADEIERLRESISKRDISK